MQQFPCRVLVGLALFVFAVRDFVLVVADGGDQIRPEIFPEQVEIRPGLPVDDVSGVDYVVDMLFRPSQCIPECLFLPAAKGCGALLM